MLYRSLLVATCLLSSVNVASADAMQDCIGDTLERWGRGERGMMIVRDCERRHSPERKARDEAYAERARARLEEVRRMQRARNPWF